MHSGAARSTICWSMWKELISREHRKRVPEPSETVCGFQSIRFDLRGSFCWTGLVAELWPLGRCFEEILYAGSSPECDTVLNSTICVPSGAGALSGMSHIFQVEGKPHAGRRWKGSAFARIHPHRRAEQGKSPVAASCQGGLECLRAARLQGNTNPGNDRLGRFACSVQR